MKSLSHLSLSRERKFLSMSFDRSCSASAYGRVGSLLLADLAPVFLKMMMCCRGSTEIVSTHSSGCGVASFKTCSWDILCSSLIGTFGSSIRYSTNAMRPPGFSALQMFFIISYGCENSWYTSTISARSMVFAGRFGF